ncbi:RICIN domain-containing protein, partial [Dysgonomonas sp. Marseille-P4677]|uniref:RICIN domain-containing protein n=1 Tax=Dysgonomonas sp. Marseille-P4677 TaxID=2364790 RepID=UPI001912CD5D
MAGNRDLHMHLTNSSAAENNSVEIYPRNESNDLSYKWLFEKVSIAAPLEDGTYTFKLAANSDQLLHTLNGSTQPPARLEIYPLKDNIDDYKWIIKKGTDNTYTISLYRAPSLYIHPVNGSVLNSTELEIYSYISNDSRLYKWIIERIGTSNSYRFRLVDPPSRFIHPYGASTAST